MIGGKGELDLRRCFFWGGGLGLIEGDGTMLGPWK